LFAACAVAGTELKTKFSQRIVHPNTTMKTIYLLSLGLLAFAQELFAQRISPQIGLNVVPLFDKTVEVNATVLRTPGYEIFLHGGYSFPKLYQTNQHELNDRYWEGKAGGAYLKLGARAYWNETGKFRIYLGPQLTAGYLNQAGKSTTVVYCIIGPCPRLEREGKNRQNFLSGGITTGVTTNLTPRLTLDLGIQANTYVFEKPDLLNNTVYVPGVGRKPVQGVASIQYTLKGR
jgi:hypothetical protein